MRTSFSLSRAHSRLLHYQTSCTPAPSSLVSRLNTPLGTPEQNSSALRSHIRKLHQCFGMAPSSQTAVRLTSFDQDKIDDGFANVEVHKDVPVPEPGTVLHTRPHAAVLLAASRVPNCRKQPHNTFALTTSCLPQHTCSGAVQ